jgi:hypothetical protein
MVACPPHSIYPPIFCEKKMKKKKQKIRTSNGVPRVFLFWEKVACPLRRRILNMVEE